MIHLVVTHEPDEKRPGGWFVVRCPEHDPLVPYGDGAVRRSDRHDAIQAGRLALLYVWLETVRLGGPIGFDRVLIVDQTAFAPGASAGGAS